MTRAKADKESGDEKGHGQKLADLTTLERFVLDKWGRTSQEKRVEVVKLLLNHGAEQNYEDKDGRSPLTIASIHG